MYIFLSGGPLWENLVDKVLSLHHPEPSPRIHKMIFTPRAHARARGYVIGRGVYYILLYISAKLFSIFQNTHFQRSILTQIGFSSNLMASGTA